MNPHPWNIMEYLSECRRIQAIQLNIFLFKESKISPNTWCTVVLWIVSFSREKDLTRQMWLCSLLCTHKHADIKKKNGPNRTNIYLPLEKVKIYLQTVSANVNHIVTECHIINQYHHLHPLNIQQCTKGQCLYTKCIYFRRILWNPVFSFNLIHVSKPKYSIALQKQKQCIKR